LANVFDVRVTRTTTRLIEDLRDPGNAVAWGAFDEGYRPVLTGFARVLASSPRMPKN